MGEIKNWGLPLDFSAIECMGTYNCRLGQLEAAAGLILHELRESSKVLGTRTH
jgi:hypothetical protein